MRLRLALALTAALAATGCGTLFPRSMYCPTDGYCPPSGGVCPPGGAACQPGVATVCPPTGEAPGQPTPAPREAPPTTREVVTTREAPARTREVVREEVTERAVTQDMLLVPRTVYMPYMPHTPTAPVRMRQAELQSHMYQDERAVPRDAGYTYRDVPTPRPAAGPDDRLLESIDKCTQLMTRMDQRITDLETRVTQGPPGPPGPQGPPGPTVCPPVVVCPTPAPPQPARRLFNRICPPAIDYCPPIPACPQ